MAKFAAVFDCIDVVPPGGPGDGKVENKDGGGEVGEEEEGKEGEMRMKIGVGTRRGGKRVLLGTVGDDSTVVYYLVHEGLVKPRQN